MISQLIHSKSQAISQGRWILSTRLLLLCRFPPTHPQCFRYQVDCGMFPGCYRGILLDSSSSSSSSCCCSCSAINSFALTFAHVPHPATALIEDHPTVTLLAVPGAASSRLLGLRGRLYRLMVRKVDSFRASHKVPSVILLEGRSTVMQHSADHQAWFLDLCWFSRCLFTPEKKAADYSRLVFSGVSYRKYGRRVATPRFRQSYLGSCSIRK